MYRQFSYLLILFLISCHSNSSNNQMTVFHGIAMTMEFTVKIAENLNQNQKDIIKKIIYDTFEEVDAIYNIWNSNSELSKLNRAEAHQWIPLSEKLETLLMITDQMVKKTNGLFDPTVAPLQKLWKNALENHQIPSKEKIEEIKEAIGWDTLHFKKGAIFKKNSNTKLDLGGIAKGYCVDLIANRLKNNFNTHFFVEWGGEIIVNGHHSDLRPWTIYISNLGDTNPEHAIDTIQLSNQAVATSGDYLQQWIYKERDKEIAYSHIINPKTCQPIIATDRNICSATVIANSCVEADALATALMLFVTIEEASEWFQQLQINQPELICWLLKRNNLH